MTDAFTGRNPLQRAIFFRQTRAQAASVPIRTPIPPCLPVWIDITLWDGTQRVEQLQAGKTYMVKLTSGLNRPNLSLHAEGIIITSTIELEFYSRATSKSELLAHEALSVTRSYEEATRFAKTFSLKIPEEMPSCTLTCGVLYYLPDADFSGQVERQLTVAGSYTPEDPRWLEACQIEIELPPQVAIVAVNPHPDQLSNPYGFKLRGWHRYGTPLEEICESGTAMSLGQLMQSRPDNPNEPADDPEEIHGKIRGFSRSYAQRLKTWLRKLYAHYGEQLCVIIVDSTELEIPWELFDLSEEEQSERFLGALARVVRWLPLCYTRLFRLQVAQERREGEVIAYLDERLGQHEIAEEREMLQHLAARSYPTLTDLANCLRDPLTHIGLVYVGCHGESGRRLQQNLDRLTPNLLDRLNWHPMPRPIVFFNACESARVLRDAWHARNFVEVVLQLFATGYIGTLSKVGIEMASLIARQFLAVASDGEIPLAESLRRLREKAVQELSECYKEKKPLEVRKASEYKLLYTFLYVYYGNPLACLRLLPSTGHEEEGA